MSTYDLKLLHQVWERVVAATTVHGHLYMGPVRYGYQVLRDAACGADKIDIMWDASSEPGGGLETSGGAGEGGGVPRSAAHTATLRSRIVDISWPRAYHIPGSVTSPTVG